jgi:hypothetical protein
VIFVLKKSIGATKFILPDEDDMPYHLEQPHDQVQAFKRQKLLEPFGFLITISEE